MVLDLLKDNLWRAQFVGIGTRAYARRQIACTSMYASHAIKRIGQETVLRHQPTPLEAATVWLICTTSQSQMMKAMDQGICCAITTS